MLDLVLGPDSWPGLILPKLELLNAKTDVRIVIGFAPHLEVANFVSRLLRVTGSHLHLSISNVLFVVERAI